MSDAVATPDRAAAEALEVLVRSVPGVSAVYPSATLPAAVVGRVLAATTLLDVPPMISVSLRPPDTGSASSSVTAVIGVSDDASARATAQATHDAIRGYLESIGALPADITVRVGMVG